MEGILNKSHAITAKIVMRLIAETKEMSEVFFRRGSELVFSRRRTLLIPKRKKSPYVNPRIRPTKADMTYELIIIYQAF